MTLGLLEPVPPRPDAWRTTRWSIIQCLDAPRDPDWESSWAYLLESYREPMERHARRILSRVSGRPATGEESEEVVGAFLATCFEKDWLTRADPLLGRFRAYVQTLLRRFVYAHVRHASAKKRSPGLGRHVFSLHDEDIEDAASPEVRRENEEFDRSWVRAAVERALVRLDEEHERYGLVIQDLVATGGVGSADLGERVGLRRPQVAVLRHRARKRFHRLFEEELSATVADEAAFEEEWRLLQPYMP